jgi:hypothetical protein
MAVTSRRMLVADAKNRALRTFIQGLAVDLAVAVGLVVYNAFVKANDWSQVDWDVLGFMLTKTGLVTAASYVMRRFLDKSSVPTPLPPDPQVEPAGEQP